MKLLSKLKHIFLSIKLIISVIYYGNLLNNSSLGKIFVVTIFVNKHLHIINILNYFSASNYSYLFKLNLNLITLLFSKIKASIIFASRIVSETISYFSVTLSIIYYII